MATSEEASEAAILDPGRGSHHEQDDEGDRRGGEKLEEPPTGVLGIGEASRATHVVRPAG